MNQCLSFCSSFFPALLLEMAHQFFQKLCMMLGDQMEMCMTEPNFFFLKNPLLVKMTKNGQNVPKMVFFRLLEKSMHQFCLEMVQNESTYDPLTFCKKCISGKNLVLKLWPKMLSDNQISVFFNQYLINELTSDCDFFILNMTTFTKWVF